jgi:hypothetical protein
MILTAVAGNYLTSYAVLPSNLTNVIALGALEGLGGPTIQYGYYLLMCMPVLGIVKGILFVAAICVLFRAPAPQMAATSDSPNILGAPARRLAMLLAVTVLLWVTDFVHHIKPG